MRIAEHRANEIIHELFNTLSKPDNYILLPDDYRAIIERNRLIDNDIAYKRVVCDFISGMTDRYALEFYCRLKSETPESVFKPI